MIRYETTKLFYNEYTSKLVVRNQLAHLFREKNWGYAKDHLDRLQHDFEQKIPLQWIRGLRIEHINPQDLFEAQVLFNELKNLRDLKLRIENPRLQIYTNDSSLLSRLISKVRGTLSLSTPGENTLIPIDSIVLKKWQPYEYRVTLRGYTNPQFATWIENNSDKVKIGSTCLNAIQKGHYTRGLYFYVRNERVLSLLQIIIGSDIQTVHKVIYK